MATKIVINGFGRIGRTILRILLSTDAGRDFEVVAVNDIEPLDTCAYLFQYDSVFGPFPKEVRSEPGVLIIGDQRIPFHAAEDLSTLDLSGVDLVMECTGLGTARAVATRGLTAGARKVLISGPSETADVTVVLGANEDQVADHTIVSNASCTTNALAPLARLLDDAFGLETGHMTTIHCYTGSQPTIDKPRGAPARSRAAALSMVPTTTSASKLVTRVLPHLEGRLDGCAVRVPVASVSAVDLTLQTRETVSVEAVNALLKQAAEQSVVFGYTDQPLVSSDLRARPESIIMAGPETTVTGGGMLRVFGWYDNEWGFSARMLDVARLMVK
ncbi:type I glyceraldehyde-3-phosphate dehydrogenase [Cochlodiniinecator piscidefendens]|uniref:type I glyceraldehyde-3-phosphate dehydrogenase n=1 Tax=Cochlodiniinecator piscidefendens TaxID=2715756 RepID=UPI00140B8B4C|nr:type I glyceraldehyde-3-phosphate dehydrogenase [Cochlodiniinecator piscidefendens]